MNREIPLYTLNGVRDADVSVHPVTTTDGLGLNLTRFRRETTDDVVLLVHGLTSSMDMFVMPEHRNLVTHLLDNGFGEVWALDSRMSNRLPYNKSAHRFTLDDLARHDYPAALTELRRHVGGRRIHVVAHCLGSVSFLMSLFGGSIGDIASMVCNSVGLTPRVPLWSTVRLVAGPDVIEYGLNQPYLDPQWSSGPAFTTGWAVSKLMSVLHPECAVPACHMLSAMWGSGWPAMYEHRNLLPVTHQRIGDICQASGVNYDRHVRKMIFAGHAVAYDTGEDYTADLGSVTTPLLLLTGTHNRVFIDSQQVFHRRLEEAAPGRHELRALPGYGHLDPFIGRHVDLEVFPHIVDFLKRAAG
ncbi:alpha/beta hydrolase [Kutzneria sp. CA-103260]|uniref:alpha/beta hydrolase n=1 Tax=Kutzneria sp. CA-103260 TaxID=2802641 RepID=UPI001BA63792|nr:alpha/beta fold hydrolase [Kutzneria sp. CA-103260]QUQ71596.1 alpha/beta fold hydrolase [Kutzneria sp. CA-103260]